MISKVSCGMRCLSIKRSNKQDNCGRIKNSEFLRIKFDKVMNEYEFVCIYNRHED